MNPNPLPHLGRVGKLPCSCENTGVCHPCKVRAAAAHLDKVYHDDTKRAKAVHDLIAAIKEATVKESK